MTNEEKAAEKSLSDHLDRLWDNRDNNPRALLQDPACWSWPVPDDLFEKTAQEYPDDIDWYALADFQADRCGICGHATRDSSALDHDHRSGLVRGWLCRSCNLKEGSNHNPTDIFARWRACPAAALLGVRLEYSGIFVDGPDPRAYVSFSYYPDWAPNAHDWPYAKTAGPDEKSLRLRVEGSRICAHALTQLLASQEGCQ